MNAIQAIIVPGNGGSTPHDNWFPYLERELPKLGITVINQPFPDPMLARATFWLPFIERLGANGKTVLIGHSSGALASMRFAEQHKIMGSVLVAAYLSDLGVASEKASGYFDQPWNWEAIKKNQRWVIQFASTDDPFVPIEEAREVHEQLGSEYYEYAGQKHFGYGSEPKLEFPELVAALREKVV